MIDAENVISIRKSDRFFICKGLVTETGELIEKERVGVAYLKPTASTFRLRLWMFPKGEFYLARKDGDHFHYLALCREDYEGPGKGQKSNWHNVGVGEVRGSFIKIRFHLLSEDVYLCLFPTTVTRVEALDVA